MEKQKQLLIFLFSIFSLFSFLTGSEYHEVDSDQHGGKSSEAKLRKIFVFGDSYGDTGNTKKSISNSWKEPYGASFPGKPAGRFSDGRILTDYLAKFMGLKSPIPYKWRKYAQKRLHDGINFAHGGTGVFNTMFPGPNMTTQINFFESLINGSIYTKQDLKSSIGLVILCGNDYGTYLAKGGSIEGLPSFIKLVVNQLITNLKHIHGTGVRKVFVTALQPLGCLPRSTIKNNFQKCVASENSAVNFHNQLLHDQVAKLNNVSKHSPFVILDLYGSFVVGLISKRLKIGNSGSQLKPCCVGISNQYSCGSLNQNGTKMYTVCSDPESAFFWDMVHPTQAGWHSVYLALKPYLDQNIALI